jgi:hypothetical protein
MVDGQLENHTILNLAWARIPQNTTSASAHVAFEFNQGTIPCGAGSDGLVEREPGDMLVVYDFEGGTTDPTIKLAQWTETAGEACDIGSHSPVPNGCWGVAEDLTASGFAEAGVNVGFTVLDGIKPPLPSHILASLLRPVRTTRLGATVQRTRARGRRRADRERLG